jgi:hypothetical protein
VTPTAPLTARANPAGLPVGALPVGALPVGALPVAALPVAALPAGALPVAARAHSPSPGRGATPRPAAPPARIPPSPARALAALVPIAAAAVLCAGPAVADEGMWMPQQVPDLASRLRKLGFEGDPRAFADLAGHPMGAVVSLGGCSASFVSPDGLIVTNHHCVVGALQFNATPERNLLKDGFLAATRADELWNGPGSRVYVTVAVREVTKEVAGSLDPELADLPRGEAIERRQKELTSACEKEGLRCRVASFFEGLRWYEIAQLELKDVRLVYAPPSFVGNYGGETDNWRWPRHGGDFAFLRAWVGKDGKPAAHSKDNVPFRPRHWLKVSPAGASPGGLVIVAGYPGRTARHQTLRETRETLEWAYPRQVRQASEMLAILAELSRASKETEIRVAARVRGLANSMKNRQGVLENARKGRLLQRKAATESDLGAWIEADPGRRSRYGAVLAALDEVQARKEATRERDAAYRGLHGQGSLLASARTARRLAEERGRPDADRDPEYQQRNWERIREAQQRMQKTLDLGADRALLRHALLEVAALPPGQRIAALDAAVGLAAGVPPAEAGRKVDAWLDALYGGTRLADPKFRLGLLEAPTEAVLAETDAFLGLAARLAPLDQELRDAEKARAGALSRLGPAYMAAMLEKAGGPVAPDANSTLRLTFGTVKGVSPEDGVEYLPQTRLAGVLAKYRPGDREFDLSPRMVEALERSLAAPEGPWRDARLGDVPVDFLSDVDSTGGNSGSAVLNGRGELVGLLFDGTYETLASDLLFDPGRTRSIQVDIRYVLWVATELSGAGHLLREMAIEAPAPGPVSPAAIRPAAGAPAGRPGS